MQEQRGRRAINHQSWEMRIQTPLLLALLCSTLLAPVSAQSGRRLPNQKSQPSPPAPTKVEAEERADDNKKDDRKTSVLISYTSQNLNIPQYYSGLISTACADRLQKSGGIKVQIGREMNRKEASDFARNSAEVYVVILQLENDSMRSGDSGWNGGYQDPRYLLINYSVFEPKTGKSRTSGRAYPRANATDPRSLPQTSQAAEYRLKQAAEDAADRILKSLGPLSPRN
jgi:hypothetical protein